MTTTSEMDLSYFMATVTLLRSIKAHTKRCMDRMHLLFKCQVTNDGKTRNYKNHKLFTLHFFKLKSNTKWIINLNFKARKIFVCIKVVRPKSCNISVFPFL